MLRQGFKFRVLMASLNLDTKIWTDRGKQELNSFKLGLQKCSLAVKKQDQKITPRGEACQPENILFPLGLQVGENQCTVKTPNLCATWNGVGFNLPLGAGILQHVKQTVFPQEESVALTDSELTIKQYTAQQENNCKRKLKVREVRMFIN